MDISLREYNVTAAPLFASNGRNLSVNHNVPNLDIKSHVDEYKDLKNPL
jgi:hypothetical protein